MKKLLMLLFSAAFLMLAGCDEVGKTDNQTPGGGGNDVTPPVVTPDGKYTLTKFPLAKSVDMTDAELAEFPFVLKLTGSNGTVYYLANDEKETFMKSNDNFNKDTTKLPFINAGRNGNGTNDETLIQMSQESLNNPTENSDIAAKVEILLNNPLATYYTEYIGFFNDIAMGFGTLAKNTETNKITFEHNEKWLFADAEAAVRNVTSTEEKDGVYTFTFQKAENFVSVDEEFYPNANDGRGNRVDITANKIGNVYISYPTIENDSGVSSTAIITMNELAQNVAFSDTPEENIACSSKNLTATVTESNGTYTVSVTNNTTSEIKDAKVYIVIGQSRLIAKTISLGNVAGK